MTNAGRRISGLWERTRELLGLRRSIVGLLGMVLLVAMGEHIGEDYLPLYLLTLGAGFVSAGVLNFLDNLLGALYSVPGGYLAERVGHKRALLIFNLIALTGFAIVIAIPHWIAVLVGAVFFLSWTAISAPASMALVADVLPKNKRTMGVSVHSLVRRIPKALGPLLGGYFVWGFGPERGVRLAFGVAFLLALVGLFMQQWLIHEPPPPAAGTRRRADGNLWRLWRQMHPALRQLLVSDILVRFCEQIPYAFVVLWCVGIGSQHILHPINTAQAGWLRVVEQATAVLIYLPVALQADRIGKKPFVVLTFVFFTLFPLALLYAPSFWWLVPVFVLRGLKEFGEPARKTLIMDLSPEDRKAAMFGLYYLIRDGIVSVAALASGFLWAWSPTVTLLTATAFGAVGTLWFALRGRELTTSKA